MGGCNDCCREQDLDAALRVPKRYPVWRGRSFSAGARALLVSHWAVYSEATVKLITQALDAVAADPAIGRAEALRRSILALIEKDAPAHPAYWAPFKVVGEGAR